MKLMMRGFSLLFVLLLFTGCSQEEMRFWVRQAQNAPAQVAVDTISKLIKAESVFRTGSDRYRFGKEDLEKLFLENEYQILVEDYSFYYCYDTEERELGGVSAPSNFLVIAVNPYGDILAKGTPIFTKKIPELRALPDWEKGRVGFETALEIFEGECVNVPIAEGHTMGETVDLETLEAFQERIPEYTQDIREWSPEEIQARLKDYPELSASLKNLESLEQTIREEVNIPQETPKKEMPVRIKLKK